MKFEDATFLDSTRKDNDAMISLGGKMWVDENNHPLYWWYRRPVSLKRYTEDADDIALAVHQRNGGAKEYYIKGCQLMKIWIIGYASGSKGSIVGLLQKYGYLFLKGFAEEVIKI